MAGASASSREALPSSPCPQSSSPPSPTSSVRVFGAGYGRTGTSSLRAALVTLLDAPVYHMHDIMLPDHPSRLGDLAVWEAAVAAPGAPPPDWHALLDARGYAGAVDFPVCLYWQSLASAYPAAKFILTVRPPGPWVASWAALLAGTAARCARWGWALPRLRRGAAWLDALLLGPVMGSPDALTSHGGAIDADAAAAAMVAHNAAVIGGLPPDRLLVYDIRDGWAPLAAFLGVAAPAKGMPFPAENARGVVAAGFWRRVRRYLRCVAGVWLRDRLGVGGAGVRTAALAVAAMIIGVAVVMTGRR
ncbi:hypothetical protein MMPV_001976 [Pyropia vietnamensis]